MAFKQKAALEHGKNTCLRGKGSHYKQEMLVTASAITFLPTSSCSDWTICHLKHIAEKEANEGGTAQGKPNQKGCKWLPFTESWCSWCMQLCSVGYPGLSPCTYLCSEKRLLTWNLRGFVMETLQSIYPLHPWHVLVFCSYTDRLFRRSNALEWTRQEQWTRRCSWVKWCELSTWIQRGDGLIQIHSLFHGAIWSI